MESLPTKSTNVEKCRVHLEDGLPVWHAGPLLWRARGSIPVLAFLFKRPSTKSYRQAYYDEIHLVHLLINLRTLKPKARITIDIQLDDG